MQDRYVDGWRSQAAAVALYPVTVPWLLVGLLVGMGIAVAADDVLPGYAVFVLLAGVGLTWRQGDPPIVPFILLYQWLSITVGYWFEKWAGNFPGQYRPGDVDRTVLLSLTGLILLAVGIRLTDHAVSAWRRRRSPRGGVDETWSVGNLNGLFALVVGAYAVDYLVLINTKAVPGLDVALQRVLDLRQVLLVTLWYEVLRRRKGYAYLWLSLAWAFVPRLGAYFSEFKSPLLLLLITYAATFRPWDRTWWPKSLSSLLKASPIVAALLILMLVWQGGLKRDTRVAIDSGFASSDPIVRVTEFVGGVGSALPDLFADPLPYVEKLVERLSYVTFFSIVLDYVPDREPHADGELLQVAVANSTMPRALFPEKPVLLSDSYYTRRFTGVHVAEDMTSISIGYMAEFYADWGLTGMFVSVFAYGVWIGLMTALLRWLNPVPALQCGVLIVALLTVSDFEHQFMKGFAALNASVVFMLLVLFVIGPWLRRFLQIERASDRRDDPLMQPTKTAVA